MEHVDDVPLVLRRVMSALRPGAAYRFVCPNYRFPFEPHFDIPTAVLQVAHRSSPSEPHSRVPHGHRSCRHLAVAQLDFRGLSAPHLSPGSWPRAGIRSHSLLSLRASGPLTILGFNGATHGFFARCAHPLTLSAPRGCLCCCRREPNRPCRADSPGLACRPHEPDDNGIQSGAVTSESVRPVPMAHGRAGRSRRFRASHDQGGCRRKSAGHWLRHWRYPRVPPVRRGIPGYDPSPEYIAAAERRFGTRARFCCGIVDGPRVLTLHPSISLSPAPCCTILTTRPSAGSCRPSVWRSVTGAASCRSIRCWCRSEPGGAFPHRARSRPECS